jgi:hypothetical protein
VKRWSALFILVSACTTRGREPLSLAGSDATSQGAPAGSAPRAEVVPAVDTGREPRSAPQVLEVPRAAAPFVPAEHFRLKIWERAINTHTLLDDTGAGAVPVSEARFLWRAGQLYVRVYAGDLDLEVRAQKHDGPVWKDDSVVLAFGSADGQRRVIQISPTGVVADGVCPGDATSLEDARCDLGWESRVRVATDYDGTLNQLGDFDEEWSVEAAVPFKSITSGSVGPGTRIPFALIRCEVAYDGRRACGSWGKHDGALVLGDS